MTFKQLFDTLPDNQYVKLDIHGITADFIKGHETRVDITTFYDYVVKEVRSMVITGYDIETFDRPLFKEIHGLHISLIPSV